MNNCQLCGERASVHCHTGWLGCSTLPLTPLLPPHATVDGRPCGRQVNN